MIYVIGLFYISYMPHISDAKALMLKSIGLPLVTTASGLQCKAGCVTKASLWCDGTCMYICIHVFAERKLQFNYSRDVENEKNEMLLWTFSCTERVFCVFMAQILYHCFSCFVVCDDANQPLLHWAFDNIWSTGLHFPSGLTANHFVSQAPL